MGCAISDELIFGVCAFQVQRPISQKWDRKQSRRDSSFQVTRFPRHVSDVTVQQSQANLWNHPVFAERGSESVRSRRRDGCHSSALAATLVVSGNRLIWIFTNFVKKVTEDANELSHTIVRLIEEANIRISSRRRSTTPRFGVWDPCGNPELQPNGLNGKTKGRWESTCSPGVCRDRSCRWRSSHDPPQQLPFGHES